MCVNNRRAWGPNWTVGAQDGPPPRSPTDPAVSDPLSACLLVRESSACVRVYVLACVYRSRVAK